MISQSVVTIDPMHSRNCALWAWTSTISRPNVIVRAGRLVPDLEELR